MTQTEQPHKTDTLCDVVARFGEWLQHRPQQLDCFTTLGIQVEGWLKGELLTFLSCERAAARIVAFDREVKCGLGQKKVDLTLSITSQDRSWIELKHHLIGVQKGVAYNAQWYLKDTQNGILADVAKLSDLDNCPGYILILATANPGQSDWASAVAAFNTKFDHEVVSLTDPSRFPDSFFLGLLRVVTQETKHTG